MIASLSVAAASTPDIASGHPSGEGGSLLVWVRVPRNGETCHICGLGHAYFYKILRKPFAEHLVTVRLGGSSQKRATTLVWAPSIDRMLRLRAGEHLIGESNTFEAALHAPLNQSWLRPPKNGTRCPFTALSHGAFYALLNLARAKLLIADLRLPGETRATALVHRGTLHRHLVETARSQAAAKLDPKDGRAAGKRCPKSRLQRPERPLSAQ